MTWDIQPFVGVGAALFGMSPVQLLSAVALPPPLMRQDGPYASEFRGVNFPVFNYLDDCLAIVSTSRYLSDVTWDGMDLYKARPIDVLRALEKANGPAICVFETIIFDKLGIQATGFYIFERREAFDPDLDDADNRVVSAWTRRAQEKNLHDLSAYVRDGPAF